MRETWASTEGLWCSLSHHKGLFPTSDLGSWQDAVIYWFQCKEHLLRADKTFLHFNGLKYKPLSSGLERTGISRDVPFPPRPLSGWQFRHPSRVGSSPCVTLMVPVLWVLCSPGRNFLPHNLVSTQRCTHMHRVSLSLRILQVQCCFSTGISTTCCLKPCMHLLGSGNRW